jgi:hypothetical protein
MRAIYATMQRKISQSKEEQKEALFALLLNIVRDLDSTAKLILSTETAFNAWHREQIEKILAQHFPWVDARKQVRAYLTFGLAQKFLNLAIKDWWAQADNGRTASSQFLHAPFDNIVYRGVNRHVTLNLPSLQRGGYYVHLEEGDYEVYQATLNSATLRTRLGVDVACSRIEVEQIIWKNGLRK